MYYIDYNNYRSVKSFSRRVRFLVMHYTAINFKESVSALTGASVSSHYLVPDPKEQTYIDAGFKDMRIFNLVDEDKRAWHAGVSSWAGRNNLNDTSIGIEIVNLGSASNEKSLFPPYNPTQIDAVKELALNILQRHPDITPTNVVGHSDIAVGRKSDPGAAFPWKGLYAEGIGAWYDDKLKAQYQGKFMKALPTKTEVLSKLTRYGYNTSIAGTEDGYKTLIRAFQLHFRPENYDGVLDAETAAVLFALVDKYFPAE
ncbi:N-acetylmuramoyl-L-alanine amidase [Bartonella australis AUST/NH1]|uniref:N-acetylmuramoyl-L-alanine amidase n=1 Tax=Bartonella australis (strain Aust/NH1) TaxID=1094489 RepID=M1P4T0_BARAA|nr:N-acetylmuramoyl-L-alanine amidase [Bartonella australis]AGF74865.1 N-acetylmuramoyl-L-alanine amidase [Bartonella australis AUST/NH1]